MDILITLVQLGLLIVGFSLLHWLIRISFQVLGKQVFRDRPEKLTTLRQNISLLLLLACVGLCLLVAGTNAILIYQGKSVVEFQLNLLQSVPESLWRMLAIATVKSILLLVLVRLCIPYLHQALNWSKRFAQNYDRITANDESIDEFFTTFKHAITNSLWIGAFILCAQFFQAPAVVPKYLFVALKAYLAVTVGRLMIKTVTALIDTLDALSVQFSGPDNWLRYYERFRHLVPAFKKCLEYVLYVGLATLIIADIDFIRWIANYSDEIIKIIAIYFLCGVVIEFINIVLEDMVLSIENLSDLQRKRRLTIIPLFKSTFKYLIYFTAAIAVLNLIHIDPTPILAGAGIVGLAIGFGAQTLINDIVCGFFILFENYYLVGDYIEAGKLEERTVEGVVEAIELRTTHIRHPDGQLQIIRNGEIGSVINYSKQYTYAKVEVPVPHRADLEQIYRWLEEAGERLQAESPDVLEPTQIDGLENVGEENIIIRTLTKVKPGKHLEVQRSLRKIIKQTFDQHQTEQFANQKNTSL